MKKINPKKWRELKAKENLAKRKIIEDLLEKREKLYKKQLEEILREEAEIGTRILQAKKNYFSHDQNITSTHNSLARLTEQRRKLEHTFWKEKIQFQISLQEIIQESSDQNGKRYTPKD